MEDVKSYLCLLLDLDKIYEQILLGNYDVLGKLQTIVESVISFQDLDKDSVNYPLFQEFLEAFETKTSLIYKILELDDGESVKEYKLADLQKKMNIIEMKHFDYVQKAMFEQLTFQEYEDFRKGIESFRNILDRFQCDDENLLEVAGMKSRVQHFITDFLEDEEVLRVAYQNKN